VRSIRQPASFCGTVGLKPTYGRVSRYGVVAFASSLDQIGPITKTVEDAAMVLRAIAGEDPHDSTALRVPVPDYVAGLTGDLKGLRVGLPKEYFIEGTSPGVRDAVDAGIRKLEELGAELVVGISSAHGIRRSLSIQYPRHRRGFPPILPDSTGCVTATVRKGLRTSGNIPEEQIRGVRGRGEAPDHSGDLRPQFRLPRSILHPGATGWRTSIRRDFEEVFTKVDVIASPASPSTAFRIGELANDPLHMYLADVFTIAANLGGICGISVPCGFSECMPVRAATVGARTRRTGGPARGPRLRTGDRMASASP